MRIGWIGIVAVASCGTPGDPVGYGPHRPIDGIAEVSEPLSDLSSQCSYTAATHSVALTLNGGDLAILARDASGAITINDLPCGGATAAAVKHIDVTEGAVGDETLIIDYGGGVFATGSSGLPGIAVDLGDQSIGDALKLVGTTGADKFVFGATGIAVNADGFVDITYAHVTQFVVSLDDGDDSFSGAGSTVTGAAFPARLTVYGGNGNDTLRGGDGDDTLNGGDGNDTFTTGPGPDGNDTLNGGTGSDTADYSARTLPVSLSLDGLANDGDITTSEADNIASDIEIIKGGAGDDILAGGPGDDTIFGGPGNDTISGGAGNNTLSGDAGDDIFDQGASAAGSDTISGGAGSDTVSYAARTNAVAINLDGTATSGEPGEHDKIATDVENAIGGSGDDTIVGSAADNVLDGGPGNDTISGGAGNDTLRGGPGIDTLHGDAGDDTFDQGSAASGADIIVGGPGIDTVDYSARTNDLVVVMDGATGSGESGEGDQIATDVENLIGGSGSDTLTGNALDNQIEGGPGTAIDTINGLAGDDVLDGGGGADIIDCGTGDADIDLDTSVASAIGCEL